MLHFQSTSAGSFAPAHILTTTAVLMCCACPQRWKYILKKVAPTPAMVQGALGLLLSEARGRVPAFKTWLQQQQLHAADGHCTLRQQPQPELHRV
jgi:hypothetical protein